MVRKRVKKLKNTRSLKENCQIVEQKTLQVVPVVVGLRGSVA